jgi:hypothetical protein
LNISRFILSSNTHHLIDNKEYVEKIIENRLFESNIVNNIYNHIDNTYKPNIYFPLCRYINKFSSRLYYDLCILITNIIQDLSQINNDNIINELLINTNLDQDTISVIIGLLDLSNKKYKSSLYSKYTHIWEENIEIRKSKKYSNIYQYLLSRSKYVNLEFILFNIWMYENPNLYQQIKIKVNVDTIYMLLTHYIVHIVSNTNIYV